MKRREILFLSLSDAIPIACAMLAAACTAPEAFGIGYRFGPVLLFCIASAVLLSLWMHVPRYGFGFGALFFAGIILLIALRMQQIIDGAGVFASRVLESLPWELSLPFDPAALARAAQQVADPKTCVSLFVMLAAAPFALFLAFSMVRAKAALLTLVIPLPMILIGYVNPQTPPVFWTVLLLVAFFAFVLLGNGLRKGETPQRSVFSVLLAPTILLFGLLLLAIFPQKDFRPLSRDFKENFFDKCREEVLEPVITFFGKRRNPEEFDLKGQKERREDDTKQFDVYVTQDGVYHLRTRSYGRYRDNRWVPTDEYDGPWESMRALGQRQRSPNTAITIDASLLEDRIVPYAWTFEAEDTDRPEIGESAIDAGGKMHYSWVFTADYRWTTGEASDAEQQYYEQFAQKQYTMPDGPLKDALRKIAADAGITQASDPMITARQVADYVRGVGQYSKKPGAIPQGEDFVLYFLTEGKEGYCVHFASATTALLQALDCPARYTIGYYVRIDATESNRWVEITRNDEHAWAELYVNGLGWVPIESTPEYESDRIGARQTEKPSAAPETPPPQLTAAPQMPTSAPKAPTPTPAQGRQPETPAVNVPGEGTARPTAPRGARWMLIPLIPILWVGTGLVIRRHREARFRRADIKRSIPDMARYLEKLERFGIPKDPDAEDWALEAVFSNHKMKAEHKELLKRVHAAQREVYAKSPIRRFLLRWVLYEI